MSGDGKTGISRRPLLGWLLGGAAAVVAGGGLYEGIRWVERPRLHGLYANVIEGLGDPRQTLLVGQAALDGMPQFHAQNAVKQVRASIGHRTLADVTVEDAAQGRLVEADGWVLPLTLAELCALAVKAA